MAKIRGKDFAKTVVITPEESQTIKQKVVVNRRAASDRRVADDRRVRVDRRSVVDRRAVVPPKGPRKGLGGWSIFLLVVVGVVVCISIVVMLAHLKVLPA